MRVVLRNFLVVGLLSWLLVSSLKAQDKSTYFTVQHANQFSIDWTGFYDRIDGMTAQTRQQLPHHLDLAYGDDPKQKLDLYLPVETPENAPVFLFIHGGGFREGDRAHYGFVAGPLAENGIITAVTSYRLTSDGFHYPSQPQDIQKAIVWLYRNISQYGGDSKRFFVGGHSAGAILAADVSVNQDWLGQYGLPAGLIQGALMSSTSIVAENPSAALGGGTHSIRKAEGNAYVMDPRLRAKANPLMQITSPPPRAILAVGAGEVSYSRTGHVFKNHLERMGTDTEFLVFDELDHAGTVLVLGDAASQLSQALLGMIKGE